MSKEVAEVLRKGLAAFGPNGENWTQGTASWCAPKCCLLLALDRVAPTPTSAMERRCFVFLYKAIAAPGNIEAEDWNDAKGRKWPEIKAAYEKAIQLAEAA